MAVTASIEGPLVALISSVREPREHPADDTRRRILLESMNLFAAQGYAGTSMRQIAAAVGIQPASIYAHFASKQRILEESFDEVLFDFHRYLVEHIEGASDERGLLEQLVQQHVRWQLEFPVAGSWDVLWQSEAVAHNLPQRARARIMRRRERYHALIVALVQELCPADQFPRVRANAILAVCGHAAFWGDAHGLLPDADVPGHAWSIVEGVVRERILGPGGVPEGRSGGD